MGKDAQALRAFRRLAGPSFDLSPIPGSRSEPVILSETSTGPELAQFCVTRQSVSGVMHHYEAVARKRAIRLGPGRPYIKVEGAELGLLSWIEDSGRRCGIVAFPLVDDESTRYVLFQGGAAPTPVDGVPLIAPVMPLGIKAPRGSRALFDMRRGKQSFAYYEVPGRPSDVLRLMEAELARAGCPVDERARRALSGPGAPRGLVSIPFHKDGKTGMLTLGRGQEPNATALSLIIHDR